VLYKLMALGLPNRSIPVTHDGEPLLYNHMQFLEARRTIEALRYQSNPMEYNTMPLLGIIEGDPRDLRKVDEMAVQIGAGVMSTSSNGDRGQPSLTPAVIEDHDTMDET
jgi:hypothetical protein